MAIEVRKMVINTVIEQKTANPGTPSPQQDDFDQLKAQLLKQCRQMVMETLRREKER